MNNNALFDQIEIEKNNEQSLNVNKLVKEQNYETSPTSSIENLESIEHNDDRKNYTSDKIKNQTYVLKEEEEEEETDGEGKENKDSLKQIPEIKITSSNELENENNAGPPPPALSKYNRSRTDSIKQFRSRFRSFSNDLLRSFENAHEMVDLSNSNFAAVTQSAAAAAQQHRNQKYLDVPYTRNSDQNRAVVGQNFSRPSISQLNKKISTRSVQPQHLNSEGVTVLNGSSGSSLNLGSRSLIKNNMESNKVTSMSTSKSDSTGEIIKQNNFNNNKFRSNRTIDELNVNKDLFEHSDDYVKDKTNIDNNNDQHDFNYLEDVDFHNVDNLNESNLNETIKNTNKSTINKNSKDKTDFRYKPNGKKPIPDDIHISILEVFIYLWGVITFFADLISDIILSIEYFNSERRWLGSLTLLFTIVPNVTLSLFSLSWYIDKYYQEKKLDEMYSKQQKQLEKDENVNNLDSSSSTNTKHIRPHHNHNRYKIASTCDSITFWITTIFFVVFQLDLVWKYVQGFVYTLKGWACRSVFQNLKWEKYYIEKQIKCDTDIGMLRLIDVFMDSGPQVLLQLYVITTQNLEELGSGNIVWLTFKDFQTTTIELKQLVSILSSLFSMGYALAGYHRCLRNQQFIFCLETNKPLPRPMKWVSTIMQFLWYLFLIAPRVLSMALFASTFRSWFFMIIFTHWLIMYFWILRLKTNYCISSQDVYNAREEIFEKFYDFVCSFIYIFVYFNLKAGQTRLRYLIYYLVFYSENVLFSVCYFVFSKEPNFTYKLSMLLIIIFGFWIALTFQIIYYLHCHPSHDIRVCVRKKTKFHFIHKETLKPNNFSYNSDSDYEDEEEIIEEITETHNKNLTIREKKFQRKTLQSNTEISDKNISNVNQTVLKNSQINDDKYSASISSSSSSNSSLSITNSNKSNENESKGLLDGDDRIKTTKNTNTSPQNKSNLNRVVEQCKDSIENIYSSRFQSPDTILVLANRKSLFNHSDLNKSNQKNIIGIPTSSASLSDSNLVKSHSIEQLKPPLATMNELVLTESDSSESQSDNHSFSKNQTNSKDENQNLNNDNITGKDHVKETSL